MRFIPIAFLASSLAGGAFAVACGSSSSNSSPPAGDDGGGTSNDAATNDTGVDAASAPDANEAGAQYPAFTPTDVPQVANSGGPVMATPKIVPIFFASDDASTVASVKDFVAKFGATQWWGKLSEYGVGAATGETPIDLTAADNPPTTWDDSQIQTFLSDKLTHQDPAFPAPDANTVYAFFTPPGVTVTSGGGGGGGDAGAGDAGASDAGFGGGVATSCTDFGGYHDNIVFNGKPVAYAVVPRCATFGNLSGIDAITGTASHEFGEAATDPFPSSTPAYARVDRPHSYWSRLLGGGEVGDMCAQNPQSFTKFAELPYVVQRLWSNKTAMTGTDPCLPVPSTEVYFNAFPVLNDTITVTSNGGSVMMKAVKIPVGMSAPVEIDLFSSAPIGPWAVEALAIDQLSTGAMTSQYLGFSFDKMTGQNGDKLTLTINVKAAPKSNTEPFLVVSKLGAKPNEQVNFWAGVVGNK